MSERMNIYNGYVEQEDTFYKKLETLEQCQQAIFDHIFRYVERLEKPVAEEVLLAIHQIEIKSRLELLHLRMKKVFLAHEIKMSSR